MTTLAIAGRALLADGASADATLRIEAGRIREIRPGLDPGADVRAAGWIAPGFVDLQLNGAYGLDFTADGRSVAEVARRITATGCTAFVPTIVTSAFEDYPRRLAEIEAAQAAGGARVLGVHLEGPYLNPARAGAHDAGLIRPVDPDEIAGWADHPLVKIVTLAPELPGALEAVQRLARRGVVVSAGHSAATFEQAVAAFEAGVQWGTHLFNAMSALGHREPGLPGALLAAAVPCGLIADGVHVHPAMVALACRAKGPAAICLVTDAMAALGMPPGMYRLGEREVRVDETAARLAGGTLAGSLLTMDSAVRNVVAFTGCAPAEAVRMAATTPADLLGLTHLGRLAPGCAADLVILDDRLSVAQTWVQGEIVYQRSEA